MKIGIIGYGKMGRAIEKEAVARGHEIAFTIGREKIDIGILRNADVAIEFSVPEAAPENIKSCIDAGIPVVVGTTAWYDHYDEIVQYVKDHNGSLFTASNFSIGVNLFFEVNRHLARLMNEYGQYDVEMEETHHIHKLDAPSGTAITLAEGLISKLNRKKQWVCQEGDTTLHSGSLDLKIIAHREDEVPGTHVVRYFSEIDEIEIKHTAKSRLGFAQGAVVASEWIIKNKGVFTMKDLLNI